MPVVRVSAKGPGPWAVVCYAVGLLRVHGGSSQGLLDKEGQLLTFLEDDNGGCLPAERHLGRRYAAEFRCSRRDGYKEWPRGVESLVVRLLKTACVAGAWTRGVDWSLSVVCRQKN